MTFYQGDKAIGVSNRKDFRVAIGPAHVDVIELRAASEPEMKPQVAAGDVTGTAADLLHKLSTSRNNRDLRPDAVAIRLCSFCDHAHPMVVITGLVYQ